MDSHQRGVILVELLLVIAIISLKVVVGETKTAPPGSQTAVAQAKSNVLETELINDITSQLAANADMEAIVNHLFQARKSASVTRAMALHFPDIDREHAYQIQMALLAKMVAHGERLVGWKMGGTRISEPGQKLDPVFGFMLASDDIKSESTLISSRFAAGTPIIEAEVCFWLNSDLPGPEVSRDELTSAIVGVGGASELISVRVRDVEGGIEAPLALGIADGLSDRKSVV